MFVGYYSSAGASTCTICSAGDDCSNPAVAPTQCAAGTYSNQGDSGCTICPAGKLIRVRVMVFSITLNNILVISWQSDLLVEESGVPWKTTDLPQVTDKLYYIMFYNSINTRARVARMS